MRARSPLLLTSSTFERRKSTGVLPPRATSSGLRPAASSPSIAQPVIAALESSPGEAPKPPSAFCTESSQLAALAGAGGLGAGLGTIGGQQQQRRRAAPVATAGVRHSKRSRKRTSIRTIAGPASRAKATLPIAWAASKGIARASRTRKRSSERSPP